jgi:hypothetical protein
MCRSLSGEAQKTHEADQDKSEVVAFKIIKEEN